MYLRLYIIFINYKQSIYMNAEFYNISEDSTQRVYKKIYINKQSIYAYITKL